MTEIISDEFWSNDISILFRIDRLLEFSITHDQSTSEKLNALTRFGIYASIILSIYHKKHKYILLSLLVFVFTYLIYINTSDDKENFIDSKNVKETKVATKKSTVNNPFGNALMFDSIEQKNKKMVDYVSYNKESLKNKLKVENNFNNNLYVDVDDLYSKNNNQRNFFTMPDQGTNPPDLNGDLKNWLYKDMGSCKENNYDCANSLYDDLRYTKPIFGNPNENPVNTEARKNFT